MIPRKFFFLLPALIFCLSGCSLIKEPKPLDVVTLRLLQAEPGLCEKPVPDQLVVRMPVVPGSLRSDRIAMLFDEREIRYLAGTRWEEPVPELIRRHMIRTLDATGCFDGVGYEGDGLISSYRLVADLQRLYLCFHKNDTIPLAEIVLQLGILDVRAGRILDTKTVTFREKSEGPGQEQMMDAMDKVVSSAMQESGMWVISVLGTK